MPYSAVAGSPRWDGCIYVYGARSDPFNKKLVVARVRPGDIANFSQYRFWDGKRWSKFITRAASLTDRISAEFNVSPLADGRFLLVFQLDRSEEHTSELQSRLHLVCRLLLEKKKKK